MDAPSKKIFTRSLAFLIPALLLSSVILKNPLLVILGVLVGWGVAWIFARYSDISNRALYTAVIAIASCYCMTVLRSIVVLIQQGQNVFVNFFKIFITSGVITVAYFGMLIPTWLVFYALDHFVSKGMIKKLG